MDDSAYRNDPVYRLSQQTVGSLNELREAVQRLADRVGMPYSELWGMNSPGDDEPGS